MPGPTAPPKGARHVDVQRLGHPLAGGVVLPPTEAAPRAKAAFHFHSEPGDPNLSRKPPQTQGKWLKGTMVERNGESTPRQKRSYGGNFVDVSKGGASDKIRGLGPPVERLE